MRRNREAGNVCFRTIVLSGFIDSRGKVTIVKRKAPLPAERVIDDQILETAKRTLETDKLRQSPGKCVVCGSVCAPNSTEGLCWVCRRLKISAWRDSDQQAAAQE